MVPSLLVLIINKLCLVLRQGLDRAQAGLELSSFASQPPGVGIIGIHHITQLQQTFEPAQHTLHKGTFFLTSRK